MSSALLLDKIRAGSEVQVVHGESFENIVATLHENVSPGDMVLTLGAGDVFRVGEQLLKQLEKDA